MPLRKSGRTGEEQPHNRQQRIHLGCNSSTMPGFSCGTDVNTAIFTAIITSHPSILQNVPRVGLIPSPVSCSQGVTLSQESSRSHHSQIPSLQHHFPSAPGRREQCQNRASCGCEQGKGSCSLSQNPHLLWHTRGRGSPLQAVLWVLLGSPAQLPDPFTQHSHPSSKWDQGSSKPPLPLMLGTLWD